MRKLLGRLSNFPGNEIDPAIERPKCFRLRLLICLAELEKEPGGQFLQNLENGATIGYNADLGNCPEVFRGKTKQRFYDERRRFLGNYKTV